MSKVKDRNVLYLSIVLVLLFFLVSVVAGGVGIAKVVASTPDWDPKDLKSDMTTFIYDREGNHLATLHGVENRIPVKIDKIPKYLQDAFIAIEDIRFYEHKGVDLKAILRAAVANFKSNKVVEGGSTITQQLVKNSFLTPEKSYERKIKEALLSFELEKNYTKEEILELYLNRVYFGHGAYGVQAAAKLYFDKDVEDLTLAESALLAGLVQAPNSNSPYKNPDKAKARSNVILNLMEEHGFITSSAKMAALNEGYRLEEIKDNDIWKHPFFIDYVIAYIAQEHNITEGQIFRGGYKIYTTLDPKIQQITEEAFSEAKNFPKGKPDQQVQGAMAILDYRTGEIKALVGGREHQAKRGFNRATDLKRQPGSTFKPIVAFGPALDLKYPNNLVLNDSLTTFKGNYTPRNANGRFLGPITMKTALTWSVNVYSVKLLDLIGVDTGFKYAQKLGFELDEKRDKVLPLALGGLTEGVSPLEMASAYGSFGNEGVLIDSTPITKILDSQGKVILEVTPKKTKVFSSQAAYLMTDMLINAVNRGTGKAARMNRPVAGKTGTSQLPFKGLNGTKDAWFVGYTPELVAAVWMGYDLTDRKHYLSIYGGDHPAQMWRKVMSKALKDEPVKKFEKPKGKFVYKKDVPTGLHEEEKRKKEEEEKKRLEEEKRKQEEEEKKRLEEEKRKQEEEEKKDNTNPPGGGTPGGGTPGGGTPGGGTPGGGAPGGSTPGDVYSR